VLDDLSFDEIKTKKMKAVLDNLKVEKALVVLGDKNDNVQISARNLPKVRTVLTNSINVYDILKYDTMVLTKDAVAKIEEVYA
jgi:large subunit ribosomal protein L4